MLSSKKRTSFLLLELLIALLLLSSSLPLIIRSFSSLISLNRAWNLEEDIQEKIDLYFLLIKQKLSFEVIKKHLENKSVDEVYSQDSLEVLGLKVPVDLYIEQEDEKTSALLIKIRLKLNLAPHSHNREFSQIYCLKK